MGSGEHGVIGVGYEGRTITDIVAALAQQGVATVVDVRLTPISRKPGLSKTALRAALAEQGLGYIHARELGNPKWNRDGFARGPAELQAARERYRAEIDTPAVDQRLDDLAALALRERLALLCFEAAEERCHRHVVLEYLNARMQVLAGAA